VVIGRGATFIGLLARLDEATGVSDY